MDSVFDDGEKSLQRALCGADYKRLKEEGYSAERLWTAPLVDIANLFPGNQQLVVRIFHKFSLHARIPRLFELADQKETRDHQLLQWLNERLKYCLSRQEQPASVTMLRLLIQDLKGKPTGKTRPDRLQLEGDMELANKAFRGKYIGDAHKTMYKELCRLREDCDSDVHYSCYTSIVQGSGTGKTRGVMQMSHMGVYICYCSTAASNSTACPPRTGQLAEQLSRTIDEFEMALYFRAWLFVLHEKVEGDKMNSVQWMVSQRDSPGIADAVYKKWEELLNSRAADDCSSLDSRNEKLLAPEVAKLKQVLPGTRQGQVQVLFVFDECRGLLANEESKFSAEESPFYQMRQVARAFFTFENYFAVVMDTMVMDTMGTVKPRQSEDHSRKVRILGLDLLQPIYQVFTMGLVPRTTDLSPNALFRYGRPLWRSRLDKDPSVSNILRLAEDKLVGVIRGDFQGIRVDVLGSKGKVKMAESQALALLSASVGLEIYPRSAQSQLLVASHMSILTFISDDRTRLHISQPVEPVVSEAAARILNRTNGKPLKAALGLFLGGCYNGYVTAGHQGEFIVKLILLRACWSFYNNGYYLQRIPLRDYLQRLLGWEKAQVDEACGDLDTSASVFFNGFMLVKQGVLTPEILAAAFMRGCAIMYKADNTVQGYDIAVPVWTCKGMTVVLVSAKDLKNGGWLNKASTTGLRPDLMKVTGIKIKMVTVLINVREPNLKEPVATKLWKKAELHKTYEQDDDAYGDDVEPVAHITVYGLARNFSFLCSETKRLLVDLSIAVPDTELEAGKQSGQAKLWLHKLLPDTYTLPIPSACDIKKLAPQPPPEAPEEKAGTSGTSKKRKSC